MTAVSPRYSAKVFQPRSRDVGLYLAARFAATLGTEIQSVAVGWQVYDITRDPVALGLVGLAVFLPMMLLVLPAGDMADRIDRRRMLIFSYLLQTITSLSLLALTLGHVQAIWTYYAAIALMGAAVGLSQPALQSFLPFLVMLDRLPKAIAWNASVNRVAVVLGPVIGGFLYEFGASANYRVCLGLYIFTLIAMLNLRIRTRVGPLGTGTAFERIVDGIRFMRSRPIVLGAISLDLFAVLLGGATALLPVFARDILHAGPAGLGWLRTAPAIGAALVALVLTRHQLKRHTGKAMFAAVAVFGIATIVFGLSRSFYLSLVALIVAGAADMISVYVRSSLIQLATPDAMRGRVGSVNSLFVGASNELGEFRAGISAGWIGAVPAVVFGGVGTLAVVGLWMGLFPPLRNVDRFAEVAPEKI